MIIGKVCVLKKTALRLLLLCELSGDLPALMPLPGFEEQLGVFPGLLPVCFGRVLARMALLPGITAWSWESGGGSRRISSSFCLFCQ